MHDHHLVLTDLCDDVLLMIGDCLRPQCPEAENTIKTLSRVNRRLRSVFSPVLFTSLCINRPVSQLSSVPLVYPYAKTLKIDMFGSMWWWCSGKYVSSTDALELFACVREMKGLKRLEATMMKRNLDMFVSAFKDSKDTHLLPGIETLVVTSAAAFLASQCPDLKHLIIEDGPSCMIETYIDMSTRLLPLHPQLSANQLVFSHLTHFNTTANWSAEEIESLVPCFPNLQHLHMRSVSSCYRASVTTIMQLLGQSLKSLKTLRLNKVGRLDMGFRGIWKRSNTATEERRRVLWIQNESHRVEIENNVVRLAFTDIESLKECWVGDKRVARRGAENDELRWIWERKREDVDAYNDHGEWESFKVEKEAVVNCIEVCR